MWWRFHLNPRWNDALFCKGRLCCSEREKIILGKRFCLEGQGLQHTKRKQREICSPMFMIKMSEIQEKQTKDGCPFVWVLFKVNVPTCMYLSKFYNVCFIPSWLKGCTLLTCPCCLHHTTFNNIVPDFMLNTNLKSVQLLWSIYSVGCSVQCWAASVSNPPAPKPPWAINYTRRGWKGWAHCCTTTPPPPPPPVLSLVGTVISEPRLKPDIIEPK